jgi:hypothetical protein
MDEGVLLEDEEGRLPDFASLDRARSAEEGVDRVVGRPGLDRGGDEGTARRLRGGDSEADRSRRLA